jgi:hypothetical protein
MVGGDANGRSSIDSINGMKMTLSCTYDSETECEDEATVMDIKEISADYLVVEVSGGELGSEVETLRVYFDEEKAKEYAGITNAPIAVIDAGTYRMIDGENFALLSLMGDGTFVYGENDLDVNSDTENGLEVGTYTFDSATQTLTFNATYDDNTAEGESGIATIGTTTSFKISLSGNDLTLVTDEGNLTMSKMDFSANDYLGTWRYENDNGNFAYLILMDDGVVFYGEKDSIDENYPNNNGLEIGHYTFDSANNNITCNLFYDDNYDGTTTYNDYVSEFSGIGVLDTNTTLSASMSSDGNTLTIDGSLVLTKEEFNIR